MSQETSYFLPKFDLSGRCYARMKWKADYGVDNTQSPRKKLASCYCICSVASSASIESDGNNVSSPCTKSFSSSSKDGLVSLWIRRPQMNEPHNLPVELEKWAYLYFNVFILIHLLVAKKKKDLQHELRYLFNFFDRNYGLSLCRK